MPTIIFKATEACNCHCAYCDVVTRRSPLTISTGMLAKAVERFDEYLAANPGEKLNVILHGGEPLVPGIKFFDTLASMVESLDSATASRLLFAVQTNLTLLSPELIQSFRRLGITGIGTSYDWVPGLRGIGPGRDTHEYNTRFMRGLNLLDEAGLTFGIIYVVTAAAVARPVDTFYNLLNVSPSGNFMFNPVLVYDGAPAAARSTAITGREYAGFCGALLPLWLERREYLTTIEPFASIYNYYTAGTPMGGCNEAEDCGPHIYIGPDGSLSQCGRSADWGLLDYGNITDTTLAQALAHPARVELSGRSALLRETDCRDCRWWELCHAGCPLDAWDASGRSTFMARTSQCQWVNIFMTEYFEPITGLSISTVNKNIS